MILISNSETRLWFWFQTLKHVYNFDSKLKSRLQFRFQVDNTSTFLFFKSISWSTFFLHANSTPTRCFFLPRSQCGILVSFFQLVKCDCCVPLVPLEQNLNVYNTAESHWMQYCARVKSYHQRSRASGRTEKRSCKQINTFTHEVHWLDAPDRYTTHANFSGNYGISELHKTCSCRNSDRNMRHPSTTTHSKTHSRARHARVTQYILPCKSSQYTLESHIVSLLTTNRTQQVQRVPT